MLGNEYINDALTIAICCCVFIIETFIKLWYVKDYIWYDQTSALQPLLKYEHYIFKYIISLVVVKVYHFKNHVATTIWNTTTDIIISIEVWNEFHIK